MSTAFALAPVQPAECPPWCQEGERHWEDCYHWGDLGKVTVQSTRKGVDGEPEPVELTLSVGCLPGEVPELLLSGNGCDGFQGVAENFRELGAALVAAADLIAGAAR